MDMNRRQAVIKMALLMGATVVGPRLLAAEFGSGRGSSARFGTDDIALLDELGDTIIPDTDVPGAKAAGIGEFIAMMVNDCLTPSEQAGFADGLAGFSKDYRKRFGESFVAGKPAERLAFLNELNRRNQHRPRQARRGRRGEEPAVSGREIPNSTYFFRTLKELTILGYFTSEIGCTQALRFVEVPGRYDGNADYRPGEHNWFTEVR